MSEVIDTEEKNEPHNSIAKNSVFFLIYNVLNIIFPFVTGIYVARVLLPDSIGQVAYAQNIAQYFVILAFLGIPTYGLREISNARNDKVQLNKLYTELFTINLISTVIFSCAYVILIFSIPAFRANISLYLIVGLYIVLNALDNSWLYEGLEEFKFISIRNIVFKTLSFVLLIVFVRKQNDYMIYALITVIGTAGNNILNMIFSGKFVKFKFRGMNLKRHMPSIMMLVVVNLAIEIYSLVDTTMLGAFCSKENVAFYSYGSKINRIFLQIINTFTIVIVPRITLYFKENKMLEFNRLLTRTLKIIILLALPMIVGIQFVSEYVVCKIYGDIYINSAYVLRILSAALLISPIGYLLGSRVILSAGKEWKMIVSVGVGAIINIIGNLILIPRFQEYGAAIASIVGEIVVAVVYIVFGGKYFKLNKFWDTLTKVLASILLMALYLYGCTFLPISDGIIFIIQFIGAVILYIGALLIMREKVIMDIFKLIIDKFKHKDNKTTKEV